MAGMDPKGKSLSQPLSLDPMVRADANLLKLREQRDKELRMAEIEAQAQMEQFLRSAYANANLSRGPQTPGYSGLQRFGASVDPNALQKLPGYQNILTNLQMRKNLIAEKYKQNGQDLDTAIQTSTPPIIPIGSTGFTGSFPPGPTFKRGGVTEDEEDPYENYDPNLLPGVTDLMDIKDPDKRRAAMKAATMKTGGVSVVDRPTVAQGDAAYVPLEHRAKKGAGKGASISFDDLKTALAMVPKQLRDELMDNLVRMGIHMMKRGGTTSGIYGEAGMEVRIPAMFDEGGTTEDPPPDDQNPPQSPPDEEDPEEKKRREEEEYRQKVEAARAAMGSSINPDEQPPPPNQPQQMGGKFELQRKPNGDWVWVPVDVPPGAGQASGESEPIDFTKGGSLYQYWDQARAEDLFPGVSKEWAEFLKAKGPREAAAFFGNYDPNIPDRGTPPPAAGGQGSPTGEKASTNGTPTAPGTGSAQRSTGSTGTIAPQAPTQNPQAQGTEEDVLDVNGQKIPVSAARGLKQDFDAGYRPNQQADEQRRQKIASGELSPLKTNEKKLRELPLPTPGNTVMSQNDGNIYRWDRDRDGKWTLFRQASTEESQRFMDQQAPGNMGISQGVRSHIQNMADWVPVRSTTDINEVRQMNALVMGGSNPALESNPEYTGRPKDLRGEYELDRGFREQLDQALDFYDTPEGLRQRLQQKADQDPQFRAQLASALIESGDIPAPPQPDAELPKEAVFEYDEDGNAKLRDGWTFIQTGNNPISGMLVSPNKIKYKYTSGADTITLITNPT